MTDDTERDTDTRISAKLEELKDKRINERMNGKVNSEDMSTVQDTHNTQDSQDPPDELSRAKQVIQKERETRAKKFLQEIQILQQEYRCELYVQSNLGIINGENVERMDGVGEIAVRVLD